MTQDDGFLRHGLLARIGVRHGFGTRHAIEPRGVVSPRQVHGADVSLVGPSGELEPPEADAVATARAGVPVSVMTADCVPVLAASGAGTSVAAIHAGWRGLASGVIEAGIEALRELTGRSAEVRAVIGPCIGACCYEVDEPVLSALRLRFGDDLERGLVPTRPGHARLDLGQIVGAALRHAGLSDAQWGRVDGACTRCDSLRFHSYRRDGPRAGRMIHYVVARKSEMSARDSAKTYPTQG